MKTSFTFSIISSSVSALIIFSSLDFGSVEYINTPNKEVSYLDFSDVYDIPPDQDVEG